MIEFMRLAVEEAKKGLHNDEGGPFGAVIVKEGKVIATAHNEVIKTNDPTAHAEINAIRKATQKLGNFDLSGCEIYATCMPCPMCLGALQWANIDKIYYCATSEDADKAGFRDLKFYESIEDNLIQIDAKECSELFAMWMQKEDRVEY
ncbi:MAG TPA: nucleoside deaminase [Epsilonproteobacteria bacterium]|nr:nucleoside deaminase [Campylobacterota bacterium]